MTDTDIAALVERLRDPKPLPWKYVLKAADALEALQVKVSEVREVKDGYYEAMAEWRKRAENAEAEIERLRKP